MVLVLAKWQEKYSPWLPQKVCFDFAFEISANHMSWFFRLTNSDWSIGNCIHVLTKFPVVLELWTFEKLWLYVNIFYAILQNGQLEKFWTGVGRATRKEDIFDDGHVGRCIFTVKLYIYIIKAWKFFNL